MWGPENDSTDLIGTAPEDSTGTVLKGQGEVVQYFEAMPVVESSASAHSTAAVGMCLPTLTTACAFEAVPPAAATQQKTPAGH